MSRSAVKVVLRTRPSDAFAQDQFQISQDTKTVTIVHGGRSSGLPNEKSGPPQQYQFKFDGILHNAPQEDVFELCASEVIQAALQGINGTIMSYGQTGAGKTYTMTGDRSSYRQRGIIPRTIAATLGRLAADPSLTSWSLAVSYLEIYNESLYDLLDITADPHELTLYEDARGHVQVSGLRKVTVSSEAEALALFFEGEANRVIGQHQLNRESSRSHSCFMMHLAMEREGAAGDTLVSKLFLVDLAGSERVSKTRSEGLVLREAGHINRSLAILEQVVRAASEKGRDHVPYRSCKLTHVLKDSLGGNCRTVLIANVWGDVAQLDESLSTARFGARMARLVCEVTSNVVAEGGAHVRALEREVQELREELAMMELMNQFSQQQQQQLCADDSSSSSRYQAYSDVQRARLREAVLTWLAQGDGRDGTAGDAGPVSLAPLPLSSVRQLRELLLAFKVVVRDLQHTHASTSNGGSAAAAYQQQPSAGGWSGVAAGGGGGAAGALSDPAWHEYVGDGDDHSLGAAPDDARPAGYGSHQQQQQQQGDDGDAAAGPGPGSMALSQQQQQQQQQQQRSRQGTPRREVVSSSASAVPDAASALEVYRAGPGAGHAALLNDNHARLRAAKRRAKELSLTLNGLKRDLDESRVRQEELKGQRQAQGQEAGAECLPPEEYQLVVAMRDIKAQYRDTFAELALVRDEVTYTAGLLATCKAELAEDFSAWFRENYGAEPGTITGAGAAESLMAADLISSRPDSSSSTNLINSRQHTGTGGNKAVGPDGFSTSSSMQQRQTTPPLASLVGSLEDDPQAAAYYSAQSSSSKRQGSIKKHRGEHGTFSLSARSEINDKPRSRVL